MGDGKVGPPSSRLSAYSLVGQPRRKVDAFAKVTGQTVFADDIKLPRMLFGRILRSTETHARIVSVDTSKAEALDGVKAVIG